MSQKHLENKLFDMKKKKMKSNKVVSLSDFRNLSRPKEAPVILIVEKDKVMRNGIKRILEAENYRVLAASDGLELSKVIALTKVDLMIIDANLPWVDGLELCEMIRSYPAFTDLPIILLTAHRQIKELEEDLSCGADDLLSKPFEVDQMLEVVANNLKK
tara:strand:- start:78 stop:554 length:477 start_codon:yes stop_codon:yes gene_type:complete